MGDISIPWNIGSLSSVPVYPPTHTPTTPRPHSSLTLAPCTCLCTCITRRAAYVVLHTLPTFTTPAHTGGLDAATAPQFRAHPYPQHPPRTASFASPQRRACCQASPSVWTTPPPPLPAVDGIVMYSNGIRLCRPTNDYGTVPHYHSVLPVAAKDRYVMNTPRMTILLWDVRCYRS